MGSGKAPHFEADLPFMNQWINFPSRRFIAVRGPDAFELLQGLVTQDINQKGLIFAALLTPSGRFHSDFFVVPDPHDGYLIDCHKNHYASIMGIFNVVKALHDVQITDVSKEYAICAGIGPDIYDFSMDDTWDQKIGWVWRDPRHCEMGVRALVPHKHLSVLPHALCLPGTERDYDFFSIQKGIPQGHRDLIVDRSIILNYGYQYINAVSWDKGCYRGQELIARTYHRGQIRKSLFRLHLISGLFPAVGSDLFVNDRKIGVMGGSCDQWGLAALYIDCEKSTKDPFKIVSQNDDGQEHCLRAVISRCFV